MGSHLVMNNVDSAPPVIPLHDGSLQQQIALSTPATPGCLPLWTGKKMKSGSPLSASSCSLNIMSGKGGMVRVVCAVAVMKRVRYAAMLVIRFSQAGLIVIRTMVFT
jgi:hypothetical protein